MTTRALAVQIFDREGYYATVLAPTESAIRTAVAQRTARIASCVACSVPYPVEWTGIPDVSLPADYRAELATVNREDKNE